MEIKPIEWILLIEKDEKASLKYDMIITEWLDDKNLVVWTVLKWSWKTQDGTVIVFWRYSMFKLTYFGNDYYFVPEEDIIAIINK